MKLCKYQVVSKERKEKLNNNLQIYLESLGARERQGRGRRGVRWCCEVEINNVERC
jgi:hypothetical protein